VNTFARGGNGQAPQQRPGWRTFRVVAGERLSSLERRVRGSRPTPTEWVALASLAVAIGAVAMYCVTSALRAWTPNIATDAFFVAVTITVVERAIRREARRRLQPRVESVMYHTRMQMKMFASSVVTDYSGTHLHTFRPVDQDMLAFLEQWLADQDRQGGQEVRRGPSPARRPRPDHLRGSDAASRRGAQPPHARARLVLGGSGRTDAGRAVAPRARAGVSVPAGEPNALRVRRRRGPGGCIV
jgi:hypothetical protein